MIQAIKNQISINNLKSNLLFWLSALCLVGLMFKPEKKWIILSVCLLVIAGLLSAFVSNFYKRFMQSGLLSKAFSVFVATFAACLLLDRFVSDKDKLPKTIISCALALASMYFLMLATSLFISELKRILIDTIRFKKLKAMLINLKSNWIIILSAFVYMRMNAQLTRNGFFSLMLAYIVILIVFTQIPKIDVRALLNKISMPVKIYALMSTIGISIFSRETYLLGFYQYGLLKKFVEHFVARFGFDPNPHLRYLSVLLVLLSSVSVFLFVSMLLNFVTEKIAKAFTTLGKTELVIYSIIALSLIAFVTVIYCNTNAFWGMDNKFDTIYTSDSADMISRNVYLKIYHNENDIRQPLFAVFSAPILGFGYTFAGPLSRISPLFMGLFMNYVQLIMLVVTTVLLARMLKLNKTGRICFMLVSAITYPTLLFSLMMEQYIVAYFWLVFVIYSYIECKKASPVAITAAGGTLLTSMLMIPLTYKYSPDDKKPVRKLVTAVEKSVLTFVMFFFMFGRLDILLVLTKKVEQLSRFAGGYRPISRMFQYLSFVASCFVAPNALRIEWLGSHESWQLSLTIPIYIVIVGTLVLTLCLISFIIYRKDTLTRIAAVWVCLSIVLLCVCGWGSDENGMVLYTLYFGWAFMVLLFKLIIKLSEKLKTKYMIPIFSGAVIIAIALLNYQGISKLLAFAFKYYPY